MKFNATTKERYDHPSKCELKNDLLYEIRMGDMGDPYGLTMGWLAAIADYLKTRDAVPPEWGYKPGLGGADESTYEYQTLREFAGDDWQTVLKIGETMHRWNERIRSRGEEY